MDPVLSKVRWLLCSAIISLDFGYVEATTKAGVMTMWSLNSDVITGSNIAHEGGPSACRFADPHNGGLGSPAATSPYIITRHYCAADVKTLFQGGQACGKCYQISYNGNAGGSDGSTVIQVVNSGHMEWGAVFDCQVDAFQKITHARSGVYNIDYKEVSCHTADGGGRATMLSEPDDFHSKFVFSNFVHPPASVTMVSNRVEHQLVMDSCCGTWSGSMDYQHSAVGFKLTLTDGSTEIFHNCFDGTQRRSDYCQQFSAVKHQECANSYREGHHSCESSMYGVCVGYQPDLKWGECQQTPEDPSNQQCDGNFGSDTTNPCRDPRYRACVGLQRGDTWGKCLQLLPFDPSDEDCVNNCKNPEYPRCVGFEENVSVGKCRQPPADPSFGDCGGDSDCKYPYSKCVGYKHDGRWGSCVEGASAVLPSVSPLGFPHQSHVILVSCTSLAFIVLGLAARWRSRKATSHLPESSGLMLDE